MLTISVTDYHIKNGSKTDTHTCPVALSLLDSIKGHLYCAEYEFLHVHQSLRLIRYSTPKIVKQFLKDFIAGKDVKPFSIEITEIDSAQG